MDARLLEILVCPISKTSLVYRKESEELWCKVSRLAYPVRDDIPVMLEEEARNLTPEELSQL
jgi:hypothetical protein